MTESNERKAIMMNSRMLNQFGISKLANLGIYRDLILALSNSDFEELIQKNIYFNPLFSPASQSDLNIDLCKGAKIITIDINSLKKFTSNEGVAIILHEIGHAVNPYIKGEQGEFISDDYAKNRNYGEALISSLEKGRELWPDEFSKLLTDKRCNRLKE